MTTPFSTPVSASSQSVYVGIDVAKEKLDLARSNDLESILTVTNDVAGIKTILKTLAAAKPVLIVVEATGGYERALTDALLDAGLPVALVNPKRVRDYAKSLGILAKTDVIDARVLTRYATAASLPLLQKRSASAIELDALVTCRRQLIETRTAQTNRLAMTASPTALRALKKVIQTLQGQIQSLDVQIKKLIESDDDLGSKSKLLRTVKGIGPVMGANLIAELPELGQVDHRRLAALVGVAPFNNDSGPRQGKRSIRGGRRELRCSLYMATHAAMRFNPVIKALAQRLTDKGKVFKVVAVACMRKLITLLNAMVRDNLRWDQLAVVKAATGARWHEL